MAKKQERLFVKSADTSTPVANSKVEIEKMLRRYGVVGLQVSNEFDDAGLPTRAVLTFVIPDSREKNAAKVPVRLPVDVRRIYDALYGRPTKRVFIPPDDRPAGKEYVAYRTVHDVAGYDAKRLAQAERVAWRNLKLWVDAALSAVVAGLQTVTEAFLAHTIVVDDHGGQRRMMEYLESTQGALAPGVRALLAAPAQED